VQIGDGEQDGGGVELGLVCVVVFGVWCLVCGVLWGVMICEIAGMCRMCAISCLPAGQALRPLAQCAKPRTARLKSARGEVLNARKRIDH
jgi:hypothetical protein